MNQIRITTGNGSIRVCGPFSESNNDEWRNLGGKFSDGGWTLPDNDTTRETIVNLFGGLSDDIDVLVPWERCSGSQIVQIGGYVLASRRGRDYRVQLPDGVALAAGRFPSSGGSMKNPRVAGDESVVFRVTVRAGFAEARGLQPVANIPETAKLAV